jgi:glycyl-tRNA synthetase alpha subunit
MSNKVLTYGQERLFRKVTSVPIHSFVEWLDSFSHVLRPADVTVKEVNHIRCFAIDIAKDLILLSCHIAMEHLCVLQLETALATLVTTWFTLADRR